MPSGKSAAILGLIILLTVAGSGLSAVTFDLEPVEFNGACHFQIKVEGSNLVNTELTSIAVITDRGEWIGFARQSTCPASVERRTLTQEELRQTPPRTVILERVYKGPDDLYQWGQDVKNGKTGQRKVTVSVMNSAFVTFRSLSLEDAWPSHWELRKVDASGLTLERIYLTCSRLRAE